jgi:hypothetical protein
MVDLVGIEPTTSSMPIELEKSQAVDELSGINRMSRQNWHNRRSLTPI